MTTNQQLFVMQPNISPTSAEFTLVSQLFAKADPHRTGTMTSDAAVKIFKGAKLSAAILSEIWNIANQSNSPNLSRKEVAVVVRLIGWAQKGEKVTAAQVARPGPLAVIEGINTAAVQNTGMSLPRSPSASATFPLLTPQDKTKFQNLFLKAGAANGVLSGERTRDLFLKSKLSNEQLMMIWNLADTQDRGYLDVVDFAIGMYFIQGVMSNAISFIPTSLPPGLYQQAGGASSVQTHATGTSGSFSPVHNSFGPHVTGQTVAPVQSTLFPSHLSTAAAAPALPARRQTNGDTQPADWDVSPAEKKKADLLFDSLDAQSKGYIEGDVAVPFMIKSQLPGEVLAQVWDLADIHQDGRLTREGFAIAMHLIQKKLAGHDVPYTLPPSLVPPTLRDSILGSSFTPGTVPAQSEPVIDLVSFGDTPPPRVIELQRMQPAGILKPQATSPKINTVPKGSTQLSWDDDPFSLPSQSSTQNFLDGDNHSNTSQILHEQLAEIGNVGNQLSSTEKSLSAAKQERQQLEQTLTDQASQLSSLQTQLSSSNAAYETEMASLSNLKDRRSAQVTEIQRAREELIRAESDLSAIRVERSEIEGAFLRDKEEARELHKRMVEASQQADFLKAEVEKLKKEVKQQKGLLAIARKQLCSKEAEKAKIEKGYEDAVAETTSLNEEINVIEVEIASVPPTGPFCTSSDTLTFAASQPLPVTPDPIQSARNNSNNPFERLAMSSDPSTPRSQSPFCGLQKPMTSTSPNGVASPIPHLVAEDFFSIEEEGSIDKLSLSLPCVGLNAMEDTSVVVPEGSASPTDNFLTPPTTATATDSVSSLAASDFPPLENMPVAQVLFPVPFASESSTPDLSSQPKVLDIEEPDSSDDESSNADEDSVPTAVTTNGKVQVPAPLGEVVKEDSPSKNITPAVSRKSTHADLSFDAIFGTSSTPNQNQLEEKRIPFDVFDPPAVQTKETASSKPSAPSHFDDAAEFDQTFPTSWEVPPSAPVNFSFDNDFEETFNFNSAKIGFPSVPVEPNALDKPSSDTIFTPSNVIAPNLMIVPDPLVAPAEAGGTPSQPVLSDASKPAGVYDNRDSTQPITENKPSSPAASVAPPPVSAAPMQGDGSMPGAFPSQQGLPATSRKSVEKDKRIPGSPKPRVSSSSKEQEKPKEQTRHSKLSIRLPFGRKKKHQEPLPLPPSSHLSPPMEEPQESSTLANGDVEAVKQLTAMGFSRSQAVLALEKSDYDVQRALNNILGTR